MNAHESKKEEPKPQNVEISLIDDSHLKRVNSVNQHKLNEVNLYYERLKKSNNPQELKLIYKKIILYLNSSGLEKRIVEGLVQKVHRIIQEKDLK
jgi:hypothetical protein